MLKEAGIGRVVGVVKEDGTDLEARKVGDVREVGEALEEGRVIGLALETKGVGEI